MYVIGMDPEIVNVNLFVPARRSTYLKGMYTRLS